MAVKNPNIVKRPINRFAESAPAVGNDKPARYRSNKSIGAEVAGAWNPDNPYGNWSGKNAWLRSYNPDDLVKSKGKGLLIYQDMTREPIVKAALQQKTSSLLSVPWGVKPASTDPDDVERARFVMWNLKNLSGGFARDVWEMCDALITGHSIQEKILDLIENGEWKGMVRLKALKSKNPYYFGFAFDEFMNLLPEGVIMTLSSDGRSEVPLESDRFFIFSFLKKYENMYGQSDLRAAYRAYWIKENAWRFRAIYMERFSGNNLKGKYPRNKDSAANKAALLEIFRSWQNETGVAIPEDLEIEVMQLSSSSDSEYARAMADCNTDIAIGILGETLTLNEGKKTGARNMGEIHQEVVDLFILFLDMILTSDINEQLVRPLVDLNYVNVTAYPEFYWYPREDYDPAVFGEAIKKWQEAGAKISKNWFYERTRMPLPTGKEDELEPVPAADGQFGVRSQEPGARGQELEKPLATEGTEGTEKDKAPGKTDNEDINPSQGKSTSEKSVETAGLNGAQIQSATAIVMAVADGKLPRESGINQLMVFLSLTTEQAETVMGPVGQPGTKTTPVENPAKSAKEEPAPTPAKMAEPSIPHSELGTPNSKSGYRRELSKFEKFAEIPKIDTRLRIIEDKSIAASRPAYEKIFADILKQVEKKNVIASKDFAAAAKIAVNPGPLKDVFFRTLLTANMMGRADVVIETQNQGFEFGKIKKFAEAFDWTVVDEPFTPEEAIKFFSGKVPMTRAEFDALTEQLMDKAFYVSGLDKLSIDRDVKNLLTDALNNGMTPEDFKFKLSEMQIKYSTPVYGREGTVGEKVLDYHAETAFRTNIMSSYNEGRREMYSDPDVKEYFPAYEYTAIMDGRQTEICDELDGFVALADDPIWNKIWPPNHHECRSTVVTINKYDFTRDMLSGKPSVEPAKGFGA